MYSLVDATFGVGYTLGPVLGAGLYKLGGFLTPFLTSGAAVVVIITLKRKYFTILDIFVSVVDRRVECLGL